MKKLYSFIFITILFCSFISATKFEYNNREVATTISGSYNSTYDEWSYNQTTGTYNQYGQWWYNMTISSGSTYNATYDKWSYNQTLPAITSLNLSYNKWWYNQSTNLTSTTYYPTNSRVTGGSYTDSTNITKAWYYDGQSLNFTEGVGADPLDIYLNFTGVTSFDQIIMREYYSGSASHYIQVQVWCYDHNMWEEYFDFVGQAGMTILSIPIYDPAEHVSGGLVQLRLHHIQNGISSHRLYLDFVWLVDGITVGGSTNLDGYAKYSFSFNNFNGNGNFNTSANVSASYFKGGIYYANSTMGFTGSCINASYLGGIVVGCND